MQTDHEKDILTLHASGMHYNVLKLGAEVCMQHSLLYSCHERIHLAITAVVVGMMSVVCKNRGSYSISTVTVDHLSSALPCTLPCSSQNLTQYTTTHVSSINTATPLSTNQTRLANSSQHKLEVLLLTFHHVQCTYPAQAEPQSMLNEC